MSSVYCGGVTRNGTVMSFFVTKSVTAAVISGALLLALAAPAEATRRCGSQLDHYPGATHIRTEKLSCSKARRVVRAYRRKWARTDQPPRTVDPAGMGKFRCRYELHSVETEDGGDYSYGLVRCRHARHESRRVRFRIVS